MKFIYLKCGIETEFDNVEGFSRPFWAPFLRDERLRYQRCENRITLKRCGNESVHPRDSIETIYSH